MGQRCFNAFRDRVFSDTTYSLHPVSSQGIITLNELWNVRLGAEMRQLEFQECEVEW